MSDDANHTRSNAVMLSKLFWRGIGDATTHKTLRMSSFSRYCVVKINYTPNYQSLEITRKAEPAFPTTMSLVDVGPLSTPHIHYMYM